MNRWDNRRADYRGEGLLPPRIKNLDGNCRRGVSLSSEEMSQFPKRAILLSVDDDEFEDFDLHQLVGSSDQFGFISFVNKGSGDRSSIAPGAMHATWTRLPGLNPHAQASVL